MKKFPENSNSIAFLLDANKILFKVHKTLSFIVGDVFTKYFRNNIHLKNYERELRWKWKKKGTDFYS